MRDMPEAEWTAFLRWRTRTGKLALVLPSGRPTVTPVWFVLDEDHVLWFNTGADTAKARSLGRDPRACLLVDLEEPPYAFVRLDLTVTLEKDLDLVRDVATRIGSRYMGPDRAEEFGARNGVPGELAVRCTIDKVVAKHDMSA